MKSQRTIDSTIEWAAILAVFAIPLKLSITYVFLMPAICLWLYQKRQKISDIVNDTPLSLVSFLLAWTLLTILGSFFGIDPMNSFKKSVRAIYLLFSIPLFYYVARRRGVMVMLLALIAGQSLAALVRVLAPIMFPNAGQIFLGAVTESGQLALTLFVCFGMTFFLCFETKSLQVSPVVGALAGLNAITFGALGFIGTSLSASQFSLLSVLALIFIGVSIYFSLNEWRNTKTTFSLLLTIALPLLLSALLINLKRGPWAGVGIAGVFLLAHYYKRLVLPAVALIVLTAIVISPINDRLVESYDDFMIAGGRSEMWEIGTELAAKYPMGIGYENSPVLQKFDPKIPPMHTHFHNNLLNVLAETGWLGLFLFCAWILSMIKAGFSDEVPFPKSFLLFCLSLSIISWQIAGLVEYNFGDSEVMLVVYVVIAAMGVLLQGGNEPNTPISTRA